MKRSWSKKTKSCKVNYRNVRATSLDVSVLFSHSVGIYLFKVDNGNTKTIGKSCSKLTIKTPERCHWCHSGVFIVKFEQISHLVLMFPLLIRKKVNTWVAKKSMFKVRTKNNIRNNKLNIIILNLLKLGIVSKFCF